MTSSVDEIKVKIGCFIDSALKKEIPWNVVENFLDEVTSSLVRSKQIIKILLRIIQDNQPLIFGKGIEKDNKPNEFEEIFKDSSEIEYNESNAQKKVAKDDLVNNDFQLVDRLSNQLYSFVGEDIEDEPDNDSLIYNTANDSVQEYNTEVEIIERECQLESENKLSQEQDDENMISDRPNLPKDDSFIDSDFEGFGNIIHSDDLNNIELVEEFKDQLYTFIGNDNETYDKGKIHEADANDQLIEQNGDQEQRNIGKQDRKKQFRCTFCQKCFKHSRSMKIHERIHTGEVPFECKTCNNKFKQIGHLKRHEIIHTGEMPFECETCKKRFNRKENLKNHERIHTGEVPFECKTCKKRFTQANSLKRHELIHTGELPYECKTCKKRFKRMESLKTHESFHTGEKPHQSRTRRRHERTNGDKPFKIQ